jgi:hypothetical protein
MINRQNCKNWKDKIRNCKIAYRQIKMEMDIDNLWNSWFWKFNI